VNYSKGTYFVVGALLGIVVTGIAFCFLLLTDQDNERARAISAGVAKWTCDPQTGKRTFEYLKPEEKR